MSVYFKESKNNLHRCFNSIYIQSSPPNEIVLVMDGELTEALYESIKYWSRKLPIKTVQLKSNVGLGRALNIGLDVCSHDLVARMDTDDLCMPLRFEKQLKEFQVNPSLDICGAYIIEFDRDPQNVLSKRETPISNIDIKNRCVFVNPFNHMTVMYRKSSVKKAGGYMHLPWMEDWSLWLRMISSDCKCINIPEYLVKALTGTAMIERRSGFHYIMSEWKLTKIKVKLGLTSWPKSLGIFILRSAPRLLPKKILFFLYKFSRRTL